VLLGGYRLAPAIFAAALVANVTTAGTLYTAGAIALGNTLEGVAGAWLVTIWAGTRNPFAAPGPVLKFAVSAGLATVISASIGVTTLCVSGLAGWDSFRSVWMTWWLGDLAGTLVVAPLVVMWARRTAQAWNTRAVLDSATAFAGAAAVGVVAFSPLIKQTAPRSAARSPSWRSCR